MNDGADRMWGEDGDDVIFAEYQIPVPPAVTHQDNRVGAGRGKCRPAHYSAFIALALERQARQAPETTHGG